MQQAHALDKVLGALGQLAVAIDQAQPMQTPQNRLQLLTT